MPTLAVILTLLIVAPIISLLRGLGFMLAVGIVHAELFPQVPTIGYWSSVGLAFAVGLAFSKTDSSAKKSE